MEEDALPLEQLFQLRRLRDQLQGYDREELIEIILQGQERLLVERRWFRLIMEAAGVETHEGSSEFQLVPETEEEMIEVFGKVPSEEELTAYVNERLEAARIDDVDIEAIALGLED